MKSKIISTNIKGKRMRYNNEVETLDSGENVGDNKTQEIDPSEGEENMVDNNTQENNKTRDEFEKDVESEEYDNKNEVKQFITDKKKKRKFSYVKRKVGFKKNKRLTNAEENLMQDIMANKLKTLSGEKSGEKKSFKTPMKRRINMQSRVDKFYKNELDKIRTRARNVKNSDNGKLVVKIDGDKSSQKINDIAKKLDTLTNRKRPYKSVSKVTVQLRKGDNNLRPKAKKKPRKNDSNTR